MAKLLFEKLNENWNAEPNIATPTVNAVGNDILLSFPLNAFRQFADGDIGILRFLNCARYRIDPTNDHAWFAGQCRYSNIAPAWGEFYELSGHDPTLTGIADWIVIDGVSKADHHFLFYFRDEMFECFAERWIYEPVSSNALVRGNQRSAMATLWSKLFKRQPL